MNTRHLVDPVATAPTPGGRVSNASKTTTITKKG